MPLSAPIKVVFADETAAVAVHAKEQSEWFTLRSPNSWRQSASQCNTDAQGKESILVVDDEPLVRQLMVLMLQQFGYQVLEASGFQEVQRLVAANEKIHLLVTDFSMPQINGLELARWFQARYPGGKVLIATGSLSEFLNRGGEQERFAVLAKPFDAIQLGRMVRMVLDKP